MSLNRFLLAISLVVSFSFADQNNSEANLTRGDRIKSNLSNIASESKALMSEVGSWSVDKAKNVGNWTMDKTKDAGTWATGHIKDWFDRTWQEAKEKQELEKQNE